MATQIQKRRGTASEHNSFTGAVGEITVNTTNDSAHVHDGATAGGFETMRVDGDNSQVPLGPRSIQVFESSGTWTKPAGVNFIKVTVTAGGGGGGGGEAVANHGGGGGAGGTSIKLIDVTSVSSVSVTVGSGGNGGSAGNRGGTGGSSSFGSFASATGGFGGSSAFNDEISNGSLGGTAANGDINIVGGDGHSNGGGGTTDEPAPGPGGASFWGGGGRGSTRGTTNIDTGEPARAFGAGGGGGDEGGTGSDEGGDGKHGILVVEEYA